MICKKKMCVLGACTGLLIVLLIGGLLVLVKHEPTFYRNAHVAAGPDRKHLSGQFVSHFTQLLIDVGVDKGNWHYAFTEDQVNSFFQEDFVHYGEAENLRRLRISDPRIVLEDGKVRLAFRYGAGVWSTVLSYDLKVWIVPREPNMLAVEILGRRAGGLPISPQAMIHELSELGGRHNVEITAYRHEGHPVALIRFQADRSRPTALLQSLKITPGSLTIAGTSTEVAQRTLEHKAGYLVPAEK